VPPRHHRQQTGAVTDNGRAACEDPLPADPKERQVRQELPHRTGVRHVLL
jgi:hypothetical protein